MNVRRIFLNAWLILLPVMGLAQDYRMLDSLNEVILKTPDEKIPQYFKDYFFERLAYLNLDEGLFEANYRIEFCRKNNRLKALTFAYQNLGHFYNEKGHTADAYLAYQRSFAIANETNDQASLMAVAGQLSIFQGDKYLLDEALKNVLIAANIARDLKDTSNYYMYLTHAMYFEYHAGDYKKATMRGQELLSFYDKQDDSKRKEHDLRSLMGVNNTLALAHVNLDQFDLALNSYDRAEVFARRLKDEFWIGLIGGNKATVYIKQGRYDEALPNLLADYRTSLKYKEWQSAANCTIALCDLYLHEGNIAMAAAYLDSCVYIKAKYAPDGNLPVTYWQGLADLEAAKGNHLKAFEAQKRYTTERTAAIRKQETAKVANVQSAYDLERKQTEIAILTKDKSLQEEQLKGQRNALIATLGILGLAILLAVNFIYNYRRQKKVTLLIRTQHDEIVKANEQTNVAYNNLQIAQNHLVQTEKMAFLGRLTSGVAHEINTPLGAIKASSQNAEASIDSIILKLDKVSAAIPAQHVPLFFALIRQSTHGTVGMDSRERRALRKTTASGLIALGIKNEDIMAEILVNLGIAGNLQKWEPLLRLPHATDVFQLVDEAIILKNQNLNISTAVGKASKILFALKTYSHQGGDEEAIDVDVAENIDIVLSIYSTNLKQTEVIKNFSTVPQIKAYPDELSQVWTNLIHNSLQAMNGQGQLGISISQGQNDVKVEITDTGVGISPENRKNIFEPFFTTKAAGEGTGLGLSIVKKIVEKHKGRIEFESKLNSGTTFRIFLPLRN